MSSGRFKGHDRQRAVALPPKWRGNVDWRPDPAPLYVVLDMATSRSYQFEKAAKLNVNIKVVTYDPDVADAVKADLDRKGRWTELHRIEEGLDSVQEEYD